MNRRRVVVLMFGLFALILTACPAASPTAFDEDEDTDQSSGEDLDEAPAEDDEEPSEDDEDDGTGGEDPDADVPNEPEDVVDEPDDEPDGTELPPFVVSGGACAQVVHVPADGIDGSLSHILVTVSGLFEGESVTFKVPGAVGVTPGLANADGIAVVTIGIDSFGSYSIDETLVDGEPVSTDPIGDIEVGNAEGVGPTCSAGA